MVDFKKNIMFNQFFKLFHGTNNYPTDDHDQQRNEEIDIDNIGPINDNKLNKLKKYIIKDDFKNFNDFSTYFSMNSRHTQCPVSWNTITLACRCKQCQMTSNSCICVKCYLEGPHKNHDCTIHLSTSGNCDCGDRSFFKPEGWCKKHRAHQNIENTAEGNADFAKNDGIDFVSNFRSKETMNMCTQEKRAILTPELKDRLLKVFKIVRKDIEGMFENSSFRYFEECCRFFIEFTKLGDEIRSCVSESLNDIDFLRNFAINSQNLDNMKVKEFFCLSGALCSDYQFSIPFTDAISQTIPDLLDCIRQSAISPYSSTYSIPISGIQTLFHFDYQYFNNCSIQALVSQNRFDWIGIILKINDTICDFILNEYNINELANFESVFNFLYSYHYITRIVFLMVSEKPKMKRFLIEFCKSVEKFEGFIPSAFDESSQIYDVFEYILDLSQFPNKLMKNIPYFIPEIFDIFIHHLLRAPTNVESRERVKGYSQAVMLHQLFIKHMLLFKKECDCVEQNADLSLIQFDEKNNTEEKDNAEFNIYYKGEDPQNTFDFYCRLNLLRSGKIIQTEISQNNEYISELINDIYMKSIDLPMSLISNHYLNCLKIQQFVLPQYCQQCVDRLHEFRNFQVYILPALISIVQVFYSFTEKDKKDDMLKFIAKKFGAIDCNEYDASSKVFRDFSFIMFISALILDRDGIIFDRKNICIKNLMTDMKCENVPLTSIPSIISPCTLSSSSFKQKYESMNIERDWNILLPYYYDFKNIYSSVLPSIIEKTEEMILPFPEFIYPNSCNDNKSNYCPELLIKKLPEVFESKFMFAVIYFIIYEYNADKIIIQYALNLFITFADNSTKDTENQNSEITHSIEAYNFDDFVNKIKTNNFRTFAKTNVHYKGNQGISLVKLINDLGLIGISALRRTGLSIEVDKKSKKKILKMKDNISRIFRKNSQKFEATMDRRNHDCCSICHKAIANSSFSNVIEQQFENEILYIPVSIFKSASTELVDTFIHRPDEVLQNYKSKYQIRPNLKYKYVHKKCINNLNSAGLISGYFLMPKIDHLSFDLPEFENSEEINRKLEISEKEEQSSIQISSRSNQNRNERFNININLNMNNIYVNGIPLNHHIANQNNLFNNHPLQLALNNSKSTISESTSSSHTIQSLLLKSIKNFLNQAKFHQNGLEILVQMILVLDHRSRLIPEVLDDESVISFYSNLFKISTYLFYLKESEFDLSRMVNSTLSDVIYECLKIKISNQNKLINEKEEYFAFIKKNEEEFGKISFNQFLFSKVVQNKLKLYNSTDLLNEKINERTNEFLRRCYLIEKFYLCDKSDMNDSFIDWDSCLNIHYLYNHFYHQKLPKLNDIESLNLPVYRGINLPNNFLELIYPPFSIKFEDLNDNGYLCVFSGKIYRNTRYANVPFTACLNISGNKIAGMSMIQNGSYSTKALPSIYVDENGYEDPGYIRGGDVFLSQEKYNKLIDDFLTGNILNY